MAVWGVLSMLMLLTRTPSAFYAFRFLLGVAEAGFVPGAMYYLTRWYPPYRQGRVFAMLIMGASIGGIVAGPLSGAIMGAFQHAGGLRNWQWLFLLQGAPAVAMGLVLLARLPETPADAPWLDPTEREHVAAVLAAPAVHVVRRSEILAAFASSRVWVLGAAQFTTNLGIYAGVFWLPSTIRAAGVASYGDIGLVSTIPYLGSAVAMWALGRSSDLMRERRWHCFGAMLVAAFGLVLQAIAGPSVMGMVGLTLSISFFIAVTPLVWAQAGEFISGPAAAAGFAMVNIFAGSAGFFASIAMGWAQQAFGSTAGVSAAMALLSVGGATLFLAVRSSLRAPA
jgi:sugar phosphate permease